MTDPAKRRKLRETIAALSARTTDRGCTEAEALAAAEKAAELLSKHGVEDAADLAFEELAIDIGRRTVVDSLWANVARFCHCTSWLRSSRDRSFDFVYFGRWEDVLVAEYLHGLLDRHIQGAAKAFKASAAYKRRRSDRTRREAVKAFQEGIVMALKEKLWAIQWRRFPKVEGANHYTLVLSPLKPVEDAMNRRADLTFSAPLKPVKGATKGFDDERGHGHRAGRDIEIHAGLSGSSNQVAGLLK